MGMIHRKRTKLKSRRSTAKKLKSTRSNRKTGVKSRSAAARKAWATRRKLYGKSGTRKNKKR